MMKLDSESIQRLRSWGCSEEQIKVIDRQFEYKVEQPAELLFVSNIALTLSWLWSLKDTDPAGYDILLKKPRLETGKTLT